MSNSFSPSINIIRDADKTVHYIPTSNSKNIYHQIASNFKSGLHSFNIIGSYGTGKSAFLLALQKHLTGVDSIFAPINGQFNGCKKFKIFNIIGESKSLIDALAEAFETNKDEKDVLKFIRKENKKLKEQDTCLVLIVDEFGKFLEYAAKHDPDRELYFIQRLAEYANDSKRNILFISTLHQNFDAYAIGLSEVQRKEWEKVKGRLKELSFNEPVEQLLQLAADFIDKKSFTPVETHSDKLLDLINETGVFNLLTNVDRSLVKRLFPFDILAAMTLTLSLQRYGQNERSLFSFLQTDEFLGLNSFEEIRASNPFYNLAAVYNYLQYNYYSVLTSKYNPDYFKWSMIRNSLDRVELELSEDVINTQKLIKTIGLLDILGSNAAKISLELLEEYAKVCLGIKNTPKLISILEDKKIIRYQSFKSRYKLYEGTDINIEELQQDARQDTSPITNIVAELNNYAQLTYEPAKAVTYQKGTPRIFQYILSETPLSQFNPSEKEVDGIINLVFSEAATASSFTIENEPILYGWFTNTEVIKDHLFEIKALDKALTLITEDKTATNEVKELKKHTIDTLNLMVNQELFGSESNVKWFFDTKEVSLSNKRKFNSLLSTIANLVYPNTPVFRSELMNKTKVSSSIHYAKKQYISALIDNWDKPDLGFSDKIFPPEKTIYATLLKDTGLHQQNAAYAYFNAPTEGSSFEQLWATSNQFLNSAKVSKRSLTEFIKILSKKPYKLKDGLIEFWMISFLFIQREEFALFYKRGYVPRITKEVAELFFKEPSNHEIKTFDIQGTKLDLFNKYRALTQQKEADKITGKGFQETAKPFLTFYKKLPTYTQQTKSLSHDALAFRKVIKNAKELEKTFFEDLPACFGVSLNQLAASETALDQFIDRINTCIKELKTAQEDLIDRIETHLLQILGLKKIAFEGYKSKIQQRYKTLKVHLLHPRQKTLFNRLNSQLRDRKAWLNSMLQALIGKRFEDISDEEVLITFDRMTTAFQELDNLLEISEVEFDEETEEVIKLEITSSNKEIFQKNIILSKEQQRGAKAIEQKFRGVLKEVKDNQLSQAVLIKLLKELITNDKS